MSANRRVPIAVFSLVLFAFAASSLLPTPAAADWPGFQGDARHTGRTDSAVPENLSALWQVRLDAPIYASPVVGDGRLFIGTEGGQVLAMDAATGRTLWGPVMLPNPIYGTPAYEGGKLYVTTSTFTGDTGDLYVLDARSGRELAKLGDGKGSLGGPTVMAGTVFWGDGFGVMHAYETTGYTKLWTFKAELATAEPKEEKDEDRYRDDCCMTDAVNIRQIRASPVVHEERVYFGALNHMLFSVDAAGTAGSEKTSLEFAENLQDIVYSSAGVDAKEDRLFVGSYDGRLYSMSTLPNEDTDSCVQDNRRVHHPYPQPCARYLYWAYDTDSRIHSSPAIGHDKVYFGDNDGVIHAVWKNQGQSVWALQTGGGVYSSPAVAANAIVAGSYDGHVYVLRERADGRVLDDVWSYELPERVHASPAISDGVIYAASLDGTVVAIGDAADAPPPSELGGGPAGPNGGAGAADDAGTPDLTVGSITLDPEFPIVGEPVTITFDVQNTGDGDAGEVQVVLYIDGTVVQSDMVTLGTKATAPHTFTYVADEEGPLQLRITVNEDGAVDEADAENNERAKQSFASTEAIDLGAAADEEAEESSALPVALLVVVLVAWMARRGRQPT